MNIRQTLERIEALGDIKIGLISPMARDMTHVAGNLFYASLDSAEMGGNGVLASVSGHGATAEEAVEDLWNSLTTYDNDCRYVIIDSYKETRSAHRWKDGVGWTKVNEALEHPHWNSVAGAQS